MQSDQKEQLPDIYRLRVSLKDSNPEIWRTILVPGNFTLGALHVVIQCVMPWQNCHLHEFTVNGKRYGVVDDAIEEDKDLHDEDDVAIANIFMEASSPITYLYDFGEDWQHAISAEGTESYDLQKQYPVCVDGANACPPEDSGSLPGYYEKLSAMLNKKSPLHKDVMDWMPSKFNPLHFDLLEANEQLLEGEEEIEDEGESPAVEGEPSDAEYNEMLGRLCASCRRMLDSEKGMIGMTIQLREDINLSSYEGIFIPLLMGEKEQLVPAFVPAKEAHDEEEGKDLIVIACSELCAERLQIMFEQGTDFEKALERFQEP